MAPHLLSTSKSLRKNTDVIILNDKVLWCMKKGPVEK